MFADRARIIVRSGKGGESRKRKSQERKAETVMYPSAEKNMCQAADRMAAMAVMEAASF